LIIDEKDQNIFAMQVQHLLNNFKLFRSQPNSKFQIFNNRLEYSRVTRNRNRKNAKELQCISKHQNNPVVDVKPIYVPQERRTNETRKPKSDTRNEQSTTAKETDKNPENVIKNASHTRRRKWKKKLQCSQPCKAVILSGSQPILLPQLN